MFLNIFPFENSAEKDYRNVVLGIYRETLWKACVDARHNNINITPEQVNANFIGRLQHTLENKFSLKELAQIDNMSQYESLSESNNTSTEVNVSNSASGSNSRLNYLSPNSSSFSDNDSSNSSSQSSTSLSNTSGSDSYTSTSTQGN